MTEKESETSIGPISGELADLIRSGKTRNGLTPREIQTIRDEKGNPYAAIRWGQKIPPGGKEKKP